jgi:hypothetical protein
MHLHAQLIPYAPQIIDFLAERLAPVGHGSVSF